MAEIMKFDTDEAVAVRGQLETAAVSIEDVLAELGKTFNSVRDWWVGDSVEGYIAQYERISKPVGELIKSVRTIEKQIDSTIADKQEQETEIKGILDQSFAN